MRREHVDDFVQDVALTALKRIEAGAFVPPQPDKPLREAVRAWLTGIVRFRALAALGYSAREIGERLGIPEDTASTHLKRAGLVLAPSPPVFFAVFRLKNRRVEISQRRETGPLPE